MVTKIHKYLQSRIIKTEHYLSWRFKKELPESVYFFTFHKCASALLNRFVLKSAKGLRHKDYASQLYRSKEEIDINFEKKGFIYGPIRLSENPIYQVYERLIKPTSDSDFIKDKIAIFMVRDPRDMLVSAYYSYSHTHGFSPIAKIRENQEKVREKIQKMTLDEYVLANAQNTLKHFETLLDLSNICTRNVVLKYEDLITNWDHFSKDLTLYLNINPSMLNLIFENSRPREKENMGSNRRSGKPEGFRKKLSKETINSLNITFKHILNHFQYPD